MTAIASVRSAAASIRRSAASVEQTNSALLNENANKDSKVIPTQRDLLAGIVAKHYARQHLLPHDVVMAHERA
ncbi:anaerobic ribonucleoside triphosphate reductase [Klebsiella pneumoniae]|uniref:Anaerobic ribonucleoside triphosphate reductase n=1 Tax=Klebsiella pneumoniae TaxID=573 RepID=A0A2X3GWG3_KLEPN|nr:anaerobic ribonucleoside triphosphate reductase [Klebsiella pneumoniae]